MDDEELELFAVPCSCVMLLATMALVMGDIVALALFETSLETNEVDKEDNDAKGQAFTVNVVKASKDLADPP